MKSRFPSDAIQRVRKIMRGSVRVYDRALRVTREGWFLMALIFAVGIAAINTGNNLMYLVLAVMLGAVVASGVLSEESVRRLWLERSLPAEVWVSGEFKIYYSLKNRRKRLPVYGVKVSESDIESVTEAFFPYLPPGLRSSGESTCVARKRGVLKLSEVKLMTRFPFGFFEKFRLIKLPDELIVFPRPADVDMADFKEGAKGTSDAVGPVGDGADLAALRPYVEGDGLRRIHWKASARSRTLVAKVTRSESYPTVSIILDTAGYTPGADEDALERAVSETAGYAEKLIEADYMVGLRTSAGEVPYGGGRAHLKKILTHLALFDPPDKAEAPQVSAHQGNSIIISLKKR